MADFFDLFPLQKYSLSDKKYPDYQSITNILFRTALIKDVLTSTSSYIQYVVRDGDTPEILASKVYGNPEAHWVILYANDIVDPQFDWPLNTLDFNKYVADKYRSMAEADVGSPLQDYQVISWTQDTTNPNSVHHYEKVVKQENKEAKTTSEFRYQIDGTKLTDNNLSVPYDRYDSLAFEQDVTPRNIQFGNQTVIQTIFNNFVTYYDYELDKNELKRNIRIIKKEYYPQIVRELELLTGANKLSFIRNIA